jgi:hypothetical protein
VTLFEAAAKQSVISLEDIQLRNAGVEKQLTSNSLMSVNVRGDGNCFFRALSVCLHGHEQHHVELRKHIAQHMADHSDVIFADYCSSPDDRNFFCKLAATTFDDGVWVGENVIKAAAHFLQREIHVFIPSAAISPLSYKPGTILTTLEVVRLGFYEPGHYRAVVEQHIPNDGQHLNFTSPQ